MKSTNTYRIKYMNQSCHQDRLSAGPQVVDELPCEPALQEYHLLPAVQVRCWQGWVDMRKYAEFVQVDFLTYSQRERQLFIERARQSRIGVCDDGCGLSQSLNNTRP
jgi:hypothetical protein